MSRLWFVSFGDRSKPRGQQAVGAVLVAEPTHGDQHLFSPENAAVDAALSAGQDIKGWVPHTYLVTEDGPESKELDIGRFYAPSELAALGYNKGIH